MSYRVEITSQAEKTLRKLDKASQRRIAARIDELAENPRPRDCKKLADQDDLWRIRVGNFRIVYQVLDRKLLVLVIRIGDRKDIYRQLG